MKSRRPKIRAECLSSSRPCPWVGCKWHLFWDIPTLDRKRILHSLLVEWIPGGRSGSWIGYSTEDPNDAVAEYVANMEETCALDIAALGGSTLEEVGNAVGMTKQRVQQIEAFGSRLMRIKAPELRDWYEGEDFS